MNKNPDSLLDISFADNHLRVAAANQANLLRASFFVDSSQNTDPSDVATSLYAPALTPLSTELWHVSSKTDFDLPDSPNEQISILHRFSQDYHYLRFVCHEVTNNEEDIQYLTYQAYENLFSLIALQKVPKNIIRMWNFIPRILEHETDLVQDSERYRQFNAGRRQAWHNHSNLKLENGGYRVPAATGIGSGGGPLVIEALLGQAEVFDIQNPRQINAYDYSEKYGTHPPMFSRATAQMIGNRGLLFIAGTASIVQEDTLHLDDPAEQTHETFRNLKALINSDNLTKYLPFATKPLRLTNLQGLRVHLKRADDLEIVKPIVDTYTGGQDVCYVNDDICRDGLLVEIESNGIPLERV